MQPEKVTREQILQIYKVPAETAHKGTLGHAAIIGGSHGKIGAALLSAKAALKSGCGLITAFVPDCGYGIMQTAFPEAMVITDPNEKHISQIELGFTPDAIGIGPGMGQDFITKKALHKFLKSVDSPLVIDADAINILSKNKSWLKLLKPNTILTPHPREFERLIGRYKTESEKIAAAIECCRENNIIIVMKGAPTKIITPNQIFENTTGNAALATAGSGDVLTGIIASLLAQEYPPGDAAIFGVYLHGLTADIAVPETGFQSFIASDIIRYLGKAYLSLENT